MKLAFRCFVVIRIMLLIPICNNGIEYWCWMDSVIIVHVLVILIHSDQKVIQIRTKSLPYSQQNTTYVYTECYTTSTFWCGECWMPDLVSPSGCSKYVNHILATTTTTIHIHHHANIHSQHHHHHHTKHTHRQWYATSEPLIPCIVDMCILDQSSKLDVGMPTGKYSFTSWFQMNWIM